MAKKNPLHIKESLSKLKQLVKGSAVHLKPRVQMLVLIKSGKQTTKRGLADALGVNHNSIQAWKVRYRQGELTELLEDNRGGKRKPVITPAVHKAIEKRLHDAENAFRSFTELRNWIDEQFIPGINYHTVNKYVKRHFQAKLKAPRKSHIHKDVNAVTAFKKNKVAAKTY